MGDETKEEYSLRIEAEMAQLNHSALKVQRFEKD